MNLPQPPEGILDPQHPWHLPMPKSPGLWGTLKARLTGRPNEYGDYSSYVNITEADADRLIANMKKDPRGYPQLDQTSGTPAQWMERQRIYQEWLVEEYLEKPFREEVNEKIDARTSGVLDRVFPEAQEEIQEAETKEEVSEILEDKIEILEDIQEKIAPPPTENKIPDPWEDSYTVPEIKKKKKRERRRLKRPQGVVRKRRKRKPTATPSTPPSGNETPKSPRRKKTFATKFGGGLRKSTKSFGSSLLDKLEGGGPLGENMGPSVLSAGIWIGKKINAAFQDAKKERARAIEAEQSGAEVPPEVKEKGYFIRKSLAHQFGGKVIDQTVGTFFENIPSKQSSKKAGFGDKFDYGDADPNKKKRQSEIKDLATGFKKVTNSLRVINKSTNELIQMMSKLVGETSRVADTLEGIQNAIAKSIDVEIDSGSMDTEAQQATGDINIPDIDFSGLMSKEGGGLDWFDMLFAADDARDIAKKIRRGGKRTTTRRGGPKITGDAPKRNRFKFPSLSGRRFKFAEGTAGVASPVKAMIGEAGPEIVTGPTKNFSAGGIFGGSGTNIVASQLGGGKKDLMKKVQPFANVMATAFQVIGAQISNVLSNLVSVAGPFSGVIAKMFSPLLGGLATIFGLNQGAFAAEINSSAMTEKQGAKELSKFFAKFFKLFGFDIGGESEDGNGDDGQDETFSGGEGDWKPLLEIIRKAEGSWESIAGQSPIKGLTDWTIQKIANDAPSYAGAYQLDPNSVIGWAKDVGLKPTDKFTPENQNKIAVGLIEGRAQGKQWQKKEISDQKFGNNLASIWAGLPVLSAVNGKQRGSSYYAGVSWNKANVTAEEVEKAFSEIKGKPATQAMRGVVKPYSFLNTVDGIFEMDGPKEGYKVPEYLTGGQPVIGHGLEWLIKMRNKFLILPGVNKEYDVYKDPAKAFNRYEQIGQQGGVEVAGLIDAMDKLIFGGQKTGKPVVYGGGSPSPKKFRGWAADEDGAQILETLGGTRIKGASLPEAQVTPISIPRDTVTGTTGSTTVAMVQPVIQYVPVPVPGPERVEYVQPNKYVVAKTSSEIGYLQTLS